MDGEVIEPRMPARFPDGIGVGGTGDGIEVRAAIIFSEAAVFGRITP